MRLLPLRTPCLPLSPAAAVTGGGSQVVATGRSVSGSCDITATIAFANGSTSLSATLTVLVVGLTELQLYALGPNAVVLPQPLPPPPASRLRDALVLLKCDARNYDQVCAHAAVLRACLHA